MKKIYVWNTGRRYSEHGQRICFTVLDSGHVEFFDIDRNITGQTDNKIPQEYHGTGRDAGEWLMYEYDKGRYHDVSMTTDFLGAFDSITLSGRGLGSMQEVDHV